MPKSPEEKAEWFHKAMGYSEEDMNEFMDEMLGDPLMVVMSVISDAQEMVARGQLENARQAMNRAKWVQSKIMENLRNQNVVVKLKRAA